ncbi:MAG: DUF4124 domain-containing protein [Lysobacterales bacterium]
MRRRRRSLAKPITIVLALLVAGVAGLWYYQPQQRPGWVTESLPIAPKSSVKLYRWKDSNGQWVVSDQKPADGVSFERVDVRNDVNVLPNNN